MAGEISKCRERLKHFCIGSGLDLGHGGGPIVPNTIIVDLPAPYTHIGHGSLHLKGDGINLYWFRDNIFDYVYSSYLLEGFEDTYKVLKEWLRVIRPGGYLILYCHDEPTYREH
jgi:SAM-dependent methyltransferase